MNDVMDEIRAEVDLLESSSVLVRREDLIAQEIEGELVMLDMKSGHYFGLDPIASAIWKHMGQPISFKNLCKNLMREYAVSEEQCIEDVSMFLSDLLDKELVELVVSR